MNVKDDITADGWLALCIAILRGVPQQEAFRILDDPSANRKWTEDDFLEIEYLKSIGMSWKDIGDMMKTYPSNVYREYRHWKTGKW